MTTTDTQDMQKIIVLDYGSQYNQLITRRIREFGVFSELKSHKMTLDDVHRVLYFDGYMQVAYEKGLNEERTKIY